MWEFLLTVFNWVIGIGDPITIAVIILTIVLGFIGWKVVKYMMSSKLEITQNQKDISNSLANIDTSLKTTTEVLNLVSIRLEMLSDGDENVNKGQAIIVAELLLEQSFSDMLSCYEDTVLWLKTKDTSPLDDEHLSDRVISRMEECYQAIYRDIKTKLTSFKVNNVDLVSYIDDEWNAQFSHIKCEITNRINNGENSVESYLETKQNIFKSSLYEFIKEQ